jgi:hypothetical protein
VVVIPCCHLCGSQTFERDWPRRATGLAAFLRPSGAWALPGPHEPRAGARGYLPSPLSGLFGVSTSELTILVSSLIPGWPAVLLE